MLPFLTKKPVYYRFALIDSTNTWAKENINELAEDRLSILVAEEQAAGRGRAARQWVSPAGVNLYTTFCFFIPPDSLNPGHITQVMALSITEVLETLGIAAKIKWPNDILIDEKKVAGILCETSPYKNEACIITGVGLNVNMTEEMLATIDRPTTSLLAETGKQFVLEELLQALQSTFLQKITVLAEQGFTPFLTDYRMRMAMTEKIRFHHGDSALEGTFESINSDGSLTLLLDSGEHRTFVSGEIDA